ncbi:MAG TPA: carboxypeptidase-like regulatory domain-containing protein, partial [Bacteroidales bacterium]|nr:carboxypeptidase-like regulatory domain-containing protein [Bacteroidales bacterium]
MQRILLFLIILFQVVSLQANLPTDENAERRTVTISGYIKDIETGETLLGATAFTNPGRFGTASNAYGFYSLRLEPGTYTITWSYIGYEPLNLLVQLRRDTTLSVSLHPENMQLGEVVVKSERFNADIAKAQMSVSKLDIKQVKQIPAFMGEVDIIKAI